MTLESRLKKLEAAKRARIANTGPDPIGALAKQLHDTAERCVGQEITPEWCSRESPMTVFALCYDDLGTGQHRFPAWVRCNGLTAMEGVPGTLARLLIDGRGRDLREVGLDPDAIFAANSIDEVAA